MAWVESTCRKQQLHLRCFFLLSIYTPHLYPHSIFVVMQRWFSLYIPTEAQAHKRYVIQKKAFQVLSYTHNSASMVSILQWLWHNNDWDWGCSCSHAAIPWLGSNRMRCRWAFNTYQHHSSRALRWASDCYPIGSSIREDISACFLFISGPC